MNSLQELIVLANRASVEDTDRSIHNWAENLTEEGAITTLSEKKNEHGAFYHEVKISYKNTSLRFKIRSMHPYCSFEPIVINTLDGSYIARSVGDGFIIKDTNDAVVDKDSLVYQTVSVLHARIKHEL